MNKDPVHALVQAVVPVLAAAGYCKISKHIHFTVAVV